MSPEHYVVEIRDIVDRLLASRKRIEDESAALAKRLARHLELPIPPGTDMAEVKRLLAVGRAACEPSGGAPTGGVK